MREIFVESEHQEFPCPPGFVAPTGEQSLGEPVQGGRARAKPLFMHRLLAPDDLTQETLFVYRNWKSRRCYPNPTRPQSPLWWVVEGESEHFVVVEGERQRASLAQIPQGLLFELPEEASLFLPVVPEAVAPVVVAAPEPLPEAEEAASVTEAPSGTPDKPHVDRLAREESEWASDAEARDVAVATDVNRVEAEGAPQPSWEAEGAPAPVQEAEGWEEAEALPVQAQTEEEHVTGAEAVSEEAAPSVTPTERAAARDDPFRRSLDAVLAELTAPVTVDAERETRVAVRVTATTGAVASEGPLLLPTRPELVSSDFLALAEISRPALVPIEHRPRTTAPRMPPRAFAFAAGALVLFVTLAVWLFR